MKRNSLILLCCFLLLISCEDDDSASSPTPTSTFSVKVSATTLVFDDINVVRTPYEDNGVFYTDVYVTAKLTTNSSVEFQFSIDEMLVGENEILYLMYEDNEVLYEYSDYQSNEDTAAIISNVMENSGSRLRGNFSGSLTTYNSTTMLYEPVSVTNGSFDIHY